MAKADLTTLDIKLETLDIKLTEVITKMQILKDLMKELGYEDEETET
jgi:ABC-type proline/glycine betaine transport system substrate-binding protein